MNPDLIRFILDNWVSAIEDEFVRLEAATRGRRGPKPKVAIRALAIVLVYLMLDQRPIHVRSAVRLLGRARREELSLLGLSGRPTYRQLCRAIERVERLAGSGGIGERSTALQQVLDLVVPASAGPVSESASTWAVDTTLVDAWCRPVSKRKTASDPDASGRIISRPGDDRRYFGYGAVLSVRCDDDGPEVCDRVSVIPANVEDVPAAVGHVRSLLASGLPISRLVADRGFSQKPANFLAPVRSAGVSVTFDLKSNQTGFSGTFHGADIVDGWLYSPGMPKQLRNLPRPGPAASEAEKDAYAKAIEKRSRWAFRPHASPEPSRVRVASPVARKSIRCQSVCGLQSQDPAAPICRAKHAHDEACGMGVRFFGEVNAPETFQFPAHGTPEWASIYNRRSAVERFNGHLKSDDRTGFRRGRFRLRGLAKVSWLTGLAVVATNLSLRGAPKS